jgi:putative SOS response-associated peptidase YedK
VCNLYSLTKGQAAIREIARAMRDTTGNLPLFPSVFPDQMAPVVRTARDGGGERELAVMRWGFPPVAQPGARPITNVRNLGSGYWRGWLKPEFRCLVPATSFCEYDGRQGKRPTWFALAEDRPLFAFAGLWRPWTGTRGTKAAPTEGEHLLYAFLTTDANAEVAPVHPKAMPVILCTPEEMDRWLAVPADEALAMQRPLPDGALRIVATGRREDGLAEASQAPLL